MRKKDSTDALARPSPFAGRASRSLAVELRGDRALCSLIVTTTKEGGEISHYRNIRWFSLTEDRWLREYWFNDDVTNLVAIAAVGDELRA